MTAAPVTIHPSVRRRPSSWIRTAGVIGFIVALSTAVWFQRTTMVDAGAQLGNLSLLALSALLFLAFFERWVRADIVRTLMNADIGRPRHATLSLGAAATLHDVGTAASKALPLGGAVGAGLRWSIARERNVTAHRFTSAFLAYGIVTTLIAWLLPLVVLVVDVGHADGDRNDWLLIVGIASVLIVAVGAGWSMLHSERVERWLTARVGWLMSRVACRLAGTPCDDRGANSAVVVTLVRQELAAFLRRPWALLGRTVGAQCSGAVILLISLRSLGVGAELGVIEFLRVYFVAQLIGSFIPTPGGVGVVEAGLTGALVAAGVDLRLALAAVLVYRLITYVVPIVVGFVLYVRWRLAALPHGHVVVPDIAVIEPVPELALAS